MSSVGKILVYMGNLPPSPQVIYYQKDPDFLWLTNLLNIIKVKPSLDVFHSQLSDEKVAGWRF